MEISGEDLKCEVRTFDHWGIRTAVEVTLTHTPTGESVTVSGHYSQWKAREIAFFHLHEILSEYPEQLELF